MGGGVGSNLETTVRHRLQELLHQRFVLLSIEFPLLLGGSPESSVLCCQ